MNQKLSFFWNKYNIGWILIFSVILLLGVWAIQFFFFLSKKDDYWVSFNASLLEDIIFFTSIGILLLIIQISMSNPENKEFRSRVRSIANNPKVKNEGKDYLEEQIKDIVAYTEKNHTYVEIKNKNDNLVEVYSEIEAEIVNMCKDIPFTVKSGYSVKPDKQLKGNYGYIKYAGIKDTLNPSNDKIFIDKSVEILYSDKIHRKDNEEVKISNGGSAISGLKYSVYEELDTDKNDDNNWHYTYVKRFTNNFSLKMINRTDVAIKIDYKIERNTKTFLDECENTEMLPKNMKDTHELLKNETLYPGDKVLFYISSS
ncbi:hypothetical protein [Winogradskyella sp. SYSU M77433]|uniref:hypothetical protein n=1 Tax=Winogradskyella sp. SYSU M77433 TaxID=3042722 RepID=UPI00248136FA|nr:hypothetical protein [Winogradskyella sp. SYSU M77433]MDH7911348.1 hypothetical protein [Winogradskyella sp. SYSU M77433]